MGRESRFRGFWPASRRAHCSRCGYDVRGTHVPGRCPECGRWNPAFVGNPGPQHLGAWAAVAGIAGLIATPVMWASALLAGTAIGLGVWACVGPGRRFASDDDLFEAVAAVTLGLALLAIHGLRLAVR